MAGYGAIGGGVTLKTAHPDPFSDGTQKAKIFMQQIDNKIADAKGATSGRKIRYATSLLRGTAAEWASIHVDEEGKTTFSSYKEFRKSFLERFTDPNPTGTAMEKLLNLRRRKMGVQEFATKALNLAHLTGPGDQITKALVFRGLHPKDQDRMMMANSIKTETELQKKNVEIYLKRVIRLLRRKEVWKQSIKESDLTEKATHKPAT